MENDIVKKLNNRLADWEESGYSDDFKSIWNSKFKNDAKKLAEDLIDYIIVNG